MRPILIIPIPKNRKKHLAEARRLTELDARRGAIEIDDKMYPSWHSASAIKT